MNETIGMIILISIIALFIFFFGYKDDTVYINTYDTSPGTYDSAY